MVSAVHPQRAAHLLRRLRHRGARRVSRGAWVLECNAARDSAKDEATLLQRASNFLGGLLHGGTMGISGIRDCNTTSDTCKDTFMAP